LLVRQHPHRLPHRVGAGSVVGFGYYPHRVCATIRLLLLGLRCSVSVTGTTSRTT
jgi:hypothetical protein